MDLGLLLSFSVSSFLLALMPGPDNIYVITESIVRGLRSAILIAIGLNSGVLIHTLAAASGISIILKNSEIAFKVVLYGGVAYLLYLAYQAYKEEVSGGVEIKSTDRQEKSSFQLWKTGFFMNLLNPKVSLFFIAFLPQFISPDGIDPIYQMGILGLIFMLVGLISFSSFAFLAEKLRKPLSQSLFWKWIKWLKFSILLVLAFFLLLEKH